MRTARDRASSGLFAYITLGRASSALQSSLDVVLSRFAEYQGLEGAFARRAVTERAKGILMERHSVDEKRAFEMLRGEARRSSRKMIAIAERPSPLASTCFPGPLLSRIRCARSTSS